jgi:hypothetical protein
MQVTPIVAVPPAKTSHGPPLEVDRTRERLEQLGLSHAALALTEELSEAVKHDRAAHLVLDRLLSREIEARDERRIKTSLKLSNLPAGLTLGNFDFGFQPSLERCHHRPGSRPKRRPGSEMSEVAQRDRFATQADRGRRRGDPNAVINVCRCLLPSLHWRDGLGTTCR